MFNEGTHNTKPINFLRGSIIIIEGQIAVGKTTLGQSISDYLNREGIPCVFYPETVHQSWLELFLSDIEKYSTGYELFCTMARLLTYEKAVHMKEKGYTCVIDRSFDGDMVFADTIHAAGKMTDTEYEVIKSWVKRSCYDGIEPPDYLVYLDTSPEVAFSRAIDRARDGEDKYDLDYFRNLHERYSSAIESISSKRHKLIIDWNEDKTVTDGRLDDEEIRKIIDKLREGL